MVWPRPLLMWGILYHDGNLQWSKTPSVLPILEGPGNQTELLKLVKASIDDISLSCSECLRDLIMKVTKNPDEPLPELPQLEWTSQLIDVLRELLVRGADPTWIPEEEDPTWTPEAEDPTCIPDGHFKSALFAFLIFAQIKRPLALELKKILPFFLTEKCLNHSESKGTLLHALLNYKSLSGIVDNADLCMKFIGTLSAAASPENIDAQEYDGIPNILSIFNLLKTPENVNMKDCDGRTPLHLLAKGLFEDEVKISELMSLFSVLMTPQNVNCEDINSVTPYSWILVGKSKWGDDSSKQSLFSEIENALIVNRADAEKATSATIIPILRWMEEEFRERKWSAKRLERLLGCMEAVAHWEHHNYRLQLSEDAVTNLRQMKNTRWIAIVKKILRVISKNKNTAQDIWDSLMTGNVKIAFETIRSNMMEMLSICAEAGAQPTDEQLDHFSRFKAYTRNDKWAEPYLKILVSSNKEKHGRVIFDLSFLGEFYKVPSQLVQLARVLVHSMYNTWDECVESGHLINCFLFITKEQEMLNYGVIEAFNCDNWLRRGLLHLAVIFLDSLELLSHEIIEKYIEARDVHGCTPLHLAYLHKNNHAVKLLEPYLKNSDPTDHFGLTTRKIESSRGDKIEETYHEECCKVLEAKEEVMELLKPMIVMPEDEAKALSFELKKLFERLISKTEFKEATIQIAGSMREKTKSGILDEADIQILLTEQMFGPSFLPNEQRDSMLKLSFALTGALPKISWDGIHLRPIDVSGPWKVIWEGSDRGMQISLDVVLVVIYDEINKANTEYNEENIQCLKKKIMQEAPLQKQIMKFMTLEPWNESKILDESLFASEWDIIDSLPMPCRLAIIISKALIKAYDLISGNNSMGEKMPITSYMIKTVLFYLLADDELRGQYRHQEIKDALEKVQKGKKQSLERLQFNPNAKWVNNENLQEHMEEARVWAQCIFLQIKYFAEKYNWKLKSYWKLGRSSFIEMDFGQAEYIIELCDCALEKLRGD